MLSKIKVNVLSPRIKKNTYYSIISTLPKKNVLSMIKNIKHAKLFKCTILFYQRLTYYPDTQIIKLQDYTKSIYSIAFSPNNLIFATGSEDETAILYEVNASKKDSFILKKVVQLQDHTNCIYSIAFSPNNLIFATGSYDETAILYI